MIKKKEDACISLVDVVVVVRVAFPIVCEPTSSELISSRTSLSPSVPLSVETLGCVVLILFFRVEVRGRLLQERRQEEHRGMGRRAHAEDDWRPRDAEGRRGGVTATFRCRRSTSR